MIDRHPRHELLALIEGRLDPPRLACVEAHLATCASCRTEAAELGHIADNLDALPRALRALPQGRASSWSVVWARVQGGPMRRVVPLLNLYLSLAVMVFVLAAALPTAGFGTHAVPVTAGAIQTPMTVNATPFAGKSTSMEAGQMSTALASVTTAARPLPIPTPMPGVKG